MRLVLFSHTDVYLHRPVEVDVPLEGCRSYFALHQFIRDRVVALKRGAPERRKSSGSFKGALDEDLSALNIGRAQAFPDPYGGYDSGTYTLFEVDGSRLTTHASIFSRIAAGSSSHHKKEKLLLIVSDSESLPVAAAAAEWAGDIPGNPTRQLPSKIDRAARLLSLSAAQRRDRKYANVEPSSSSSSSSSSYSSSSSSSDEMSPIKAPQSSSRKHRDRPQGERTSVADQFIPASASTAHLDAHQRAPLLPAFSLDSRTEVADPPTYDEGRAPPSRPTNSSAATTGGASRRFAATGPPSTIDRGSSNGADSSSRIPLSAIQGLTGRPMAPHHHHQPPQSAAALSSPSRYADANGYLPDGVRISAKSAIFYVNSDGNYPAGERSRIQHEHESNYFSPSQHQPAPAPTRRLLLADYRGSHVSQYMAVEGTPPSRRSPPRGPSVYRPLPPPAPPVLEVSHPISSSRAAAVVHPAATPRHAEDEDVLFADEVSDDERPATITPIIQATPNKYKSVETSANTSAVIGSNPEVQRRTLLPPPTESPMRETLQHTTYAPAPAAYPPPSMHYQHAPTFHNTPNINITIRMPSPYKTGPQTPPAIETRIGSSPDRYARDSIQAAHRPIPPPPTRYRSVEEYRTGENDDDMVVYSSQDSLPIGAAHHRPVRHLTAPVLQEDTGAPPTPASSHLEVSPAPPSSLWDHSPYRVGGNDSSYRSQSRYPPLPTDDGASSSLPPAPEPILVVREDRGSSLNGSRAVQPSQPSPSAAPLRSLSEPVGPKGVPIIHSIPPVATTTLADPVEDEKEDAPMLAALPIVFKYTTNNRRPTPRRATPNASVRGSRMSSPSRRSGHVSWSSDRAPSLWGKDSRFRSIPAYAEVLGAFREEEAADLMLARDDSAARFMYHLNRVLPDQLGQHGLPFDGAVSQSSWSPLRGVAEALETHHQPPPTQPPVLFRNIIGYYVGLAWDGWRLQDQLNARLSQLTDTNAPPHPEVRGRCGLLITGPPGSGKTTTLGIVVRDLVLPEICAVVRYNQHIKGLRSGTPEELGAALLSVPFVLPLSIKQLLPADSNPTATVIQLTLDEGTEKWMSSKLWSREAFATFDAELLATRFIHEAVECLIREPTNEAPFTTTHPSRQGTTDASARGATNRRLELDSASSSRDSSSITFGRHTTHLDLCQQLVTVLRRAVTSSSEFQRSGSLSNVVFLRNDRSFLQQYLERSVASVYIRTGSQVDTDKIESEARVILNTWTLVVAELQSALGNLASVVRGEKASLETGDPRRPSPLGRPPSGPSSRAPSATRRAPSVPSSRPPPSRNTSPGRLLPPHSRLAESIDVTMVNESLVDAGPNVEAVRNRRRPTTPAQALQDVVHALFGPVLDLLLGEAHRQQNPRQASRGATPSLMVLCDDIDTLYATGHTSVVGDALIAQFTSISGASHIKRSPITHQTGSSRMLIGTWTHRKNSVLRKGAGPTSASRVASRGGTPKRDTTPQRSQTPVIGSGRSSQPPTSRPGLPLGRPPTPSGRPLTPTRLSQATTPLFPPSQLVTVFNMLGAVPLVDLAAEYPTLPLQVVCRPTSEEEGVGLRAGDPMQDRKSVLDSVSGISNYSLYRTHASQRFPLQLDDGSEVFDVSIFKGAPGFLCKFAELVAVLTTKTEADNEFLTSFLEQDNAMLSELRNPLGNRPGRLLSPTCALEVRHGRIRDILRSLAKLVSASTRVSVDTLDEEQRQQPLYDYYY